MNLQRLADSTLPNFSVAGTTGAFCPASREVAEKVFGASFTSDLVNKFRRSVITKERVIVDMREYDSFSSDIAWDPETQDALIAAESLKANNLKFAPKSLLPHHFMDGEDFDWNLAASAEEPFRRDPQHAGFPHKKRDFKGHIFNRSEELPFRNYNKLFEHSIKHSSAPFKTVPVYDILTNARSHLVNSDSDDKVRAVYGYPFPNLAIEVQFYRSFFNAIRHSESHIAYGCETLRGGMHTVNHMAASGNVFVCLDWKKFDKSVRIRLLKYVFKEFVRPYFDMDWYAAHGGRPSNRVKSDLDRLFTYMVDFFCHGPICDPDGRRYQRTVAGIPSGSQWTQVIDSLVNLYVITYILVKRFGQDAVKNMVVLGDDGFISLKTELPESEILEIIAEEALATFGMILNVEKTVVTRNRNEIVFLSYRNWNGWPVRDVDELVARFVFPERDPNDWAKMKARSIGIAWASCCIDSRFYDLVKQASSTKYGDKPPDFTGQLNYLLRSSDSPELFMSVPTQPQCLRHLSNIGLCRKIPSIVQVYLMGG
jgi:hypothetical protein